MKHSSTWFALILIASALLLSVANPSRSQIPSPVIKTESSSNNSSGQPIATSNKDAQAEKTSRQGNGTTNNYYCNPPPKSGLSGLATVVNVILTFFLVLFTGGLVYVGYKQAEWMGKQSEWMRKTNEIYDAQRELLRQQTVLAHRPRIRVRDFNLLQKLEVNGTIEISCDIANIGGTQANIHFEQHHHTIRTKRFCSLEAVHSIAASV